jgi:hypothetical protein
MNKSGAFFFGCAALLALALLPGTLYAKSQSSLTLVPIEGQPNRYVLSGWIFGSSCPASSLDCSGALIDMSIDPCPLIGPCNLMNVPPDGETGGSLSTEIALDPCVFYSISFGWCFDAGDLGVNGCSVPCSDCERLTIRTPLITLSPSPSQLVSQTQGDYDIALANDIFPQGLNVAVRFGQCHVCSGNASREARLIPRSGTGPVIPLHTTALPGEQVQFGGYFPIDNLTAPGYYDVETICFDGSRDTVLANIHYRGYLGYQSTGKVINQLTDNVIRAARVSIWHQVDGPQYEWAGGMVAGDGTYSFTVPAGIYKVLVQYELGGEQWRGPFTVEGAYGTGSASRALSSTATNALIPYEDIVVTPVTHDTIGPVYGVLSSERTVVQGKWSDGGTGLAVVEVVPGSPSNVLIDITNYALGDSTAQVTVALADFNSAGSVTLRAIDQLGNSSLQCISLAGVTGIPIAAPSAAILSLSNPRPNPASHGLVVSYSLPTSEPATIELVDIAGRILVSRRIAGAGPGDREIGLQVSPSTAPGICFIRLTQNRRSVTQKVVVLQ